MVNDLSVSTGRNARRGFTLIEIMIVMLIFGIVVAIAVPSFLRARSNSRRKTCQENLSKISGAKEQWALENKQSPGVTVTSDELAPTDMKGYLKAWPIEPAGGTYEINEIGLDPSCDTGYPGHSLEDIGIAVTELEN